MEPLHSPALEIFYVRFGALPDDPDRYTIGGLDEKYRDCPFEPQNVNWCAWPLSDRMNTYGSVDATGERLRWLSRRNAPRQALWGVFFAHYTDAEEAFATAVVPSPSSVPGAQSAPGGGAGRGNWPAGTCYWFGDHDSALMAGGVHYFQWRTTCGKRLRDDHHIYENELLPQYLFCPFCGGRLVR